MADVSPAVQQQIAQFQQIQKQLQIIAQQRIQFEMQLRETENAAKELEELKEKDTEVYKNIGNLIIKTKKEKLVSELKEKKEALEITIKKFKNQEEMYQNRLKELQKELQSALSSLGTLSSTGG